MSHKGGFMQVQRTERGFELIEFKDANGKDCSLQGSSAIGDREEDALNPGTSFVWLGKGSERMHLNHEQVFTITRKLLNWLDHGSFE